MNNRIQKIKDIVLQEKRVEVVELSNRLDVSEVTIRKDLAKLEGQGFLLRRYGGAILAENPQQVVDYLRKAQEFPEEKRAIAVFAAEMIEDGDNILLDAGSTTLQLAHEIRGRELRVVTNSVPIVNELFDDEKIVLEILGGTLRRASGALIGPGTFRSVRDIHVDKAFIGCSGFDPKRGFSSENAIEAESKRRILSCAEKKIIMADSAKFERGAFASFADLEEVDIVISDDGLSERNREIFENNGIEVEIAPSEDN